MRNRSSQRQILCPPIPYACPNCPVLDITKSCLLQQKTVRREPAGDWFLGEKSKPYPSKCDTMPDKWLELNRKLIVTMAEKMHRSTQTIHYTLLRLLHANYAGVLKIVRRRRQYKIPISGYPDALFSTFSLFNNLGYITVPMAPETIGKLMRMMRDYVSQAQLLNHQYKWFRNGQDDGDLVGLLGKHDELLKLLRAIFRDNDASFTKDLLTTLLDMDLFVVFKKTVDRRRSSTIRGISDLYEGIAGSKAQNESTYKRTAKTLVKTPSSSANKRADPEPRTKSVQMVTKFKPWRRNELLKLFNEYLYTRKSPSNSCNVLPKGPKTPSETFILPDRTRVHARPSARPPTEEA